MGRRRKPGRRRPSTPASSPSPLRALRWVLVGAGVLLVLDLYYLGRIWPDWERLARGTPPAPKSQFIAAYEARRLAEGRLPVLRWRPVPLAAMPRHLRRAVLIAEDSRFYQHAGFDFYAIRDAFHYNLRHRRILRGASTISQQTAKNLFFTPSRNPLRKWHEAVLTWGMERHLSKDRILEIYLNIVELGRGIYGVEAAARAYWDRPVGALTPAQSAELAATLPSPVYHNPRTRTAFFRRHAAKIHRRLRRVLGRAGAPALRARRAAAPAPADDPEEDF